MVRGEAGPDSALLMTAPNTWLASRHRFALLADLWSAVAKPDPSVGLVLQSSSEAGRGPRQPGSLVQEAIRAGVLLDTGVKNASWGRKPALANLIYEVPERKKWALKQ
jgi:hypothetical protein